MARATAGGRDGARDATSDAIVDPGVAGCRRRWGPGRNGRMEQAAPRRRYATLGRMLRRLLHGLGWLAYAVLLVVVFASAAYLAFSFFVRSGVTAMPPVV